MQYSYAPISVACEYGVDCVGTIEITRNEQCKFNYIAFVSERVAVFNWPAKKPNIKSCVSSSLGVVHS